MTLRIRDISNDLGVLALLWLAGLYLRLPVLVAPPLAPHIGEALSLSQTHIGALTTLPVFMLAVGALLGSLLIMRMGARNALVAALALVAVSSAARGASSGVTDLLLFSALMGLAIAVMQPALPALLPRWLSPGRIALGSACYMNGMLMGEFIGAGLTLPVIMPLAGDSWRGALLLWSLPGLLVAALLLLPRRNLNAAEATSLHWLPSWRDPLMWQMGLLLGATAALFFGTNAYMASILEQRGEIERLATALFWFNLAQVVASMLMLAVAGRWVARRGPIAASVAGAVLAMILFLLLEGWLAVAFAVLMSFCAGILLILLVTLPPHICGSAHAGRLSAGNFTIGYTLAFAIPLLGGWLADFTGNSLATGWVIVTFAALTLPCAFKLRPDTVRQKGGDN